MSGPVELTPEQIAADFCSANPGKTAVVIKDGHGIIRDSAGYVHTTVTGRFTNSTPNMAELPKERTADAKRIIKAFKK